jgi:hypothetical protein
LWQPSTVLLGRELLEAADADMSVSEHAKGSLLSDFTERLVRDPGCGPAQLRNDTKKLLPGKASSVVRPGHSWAVIDALVGRVRRDYLANWAFEIRADAHRTPRRLSGEETARSITSHLLDEGCDPAWVHRWFTYRLRHVGEVYSLADMVEELGDLVSTEPKSIEVLVPLAKEILPRPAPQGWLNPLETKHWRAQNVPGSSPVRQHGALLLSINARDIYAAAEVARERAAAQANRARLGAGREVTFVADMWLKGVPKPLPYLGSPRRVEIKSLAKREQLWTHAMPENIDSALELMSPLERGPVPAAITGAWAAIESLLIGAGDESKHVAAQRVALIAACALVRAELTGLAHAHKRQATDPLAAAISNEQTNKERARRLAVAVDLGSVLCLKRIEDVHALTRLQSLRNDPQNHVLRIAALLEKTFSALYRQRNLLSHAGGTSGVALKPVLARSAAVVAASIDRIVDAQLRDGVEALELAARARVRVDALRGGALSDVVDLLG